MGHFLQGPLCHFASFSIFRGAIGEASASDAVCFDTAALHWSICANRKTVLRGTNYSLPRLGVLLGPVPLLHRKYHRHSPPSVTNALFRGNSHGPATCSNGVPGVENFAGEVCCPVSCEVCGGDGCGEFGVDDCCSSNIMGSDVYCDISGEAPCILVGECGNHPTCAVVEQFG